ncbi:MAG: zinc ribbon domain-containing protein [Candidatus Glassbacteria bacterium]|nr:zinc ribbon domain-containing protein [Candidatus Glassbacteria bacterium]
MALIDCEICGKQVSEAANTCPHCGHPRRGEGIDETVLPVDDPRWLLDREINVFDVIGACATEAHRDFIRFLLFANSGALLIVFTLAGAKMEGAVALLKWPAFAFAIGLALAGGGVLIRHLTMRDVVPFRHDRLIELANRIPLPMLLHIPEVDRKAKWIIKLEICSFITFLAGVVIGLLGFFGIL